MEESEGSRQEMPLIFRTELWKAGGGQEAGTQRLGRGK